MPFDSVIAEVGREYAHFTLEDVQDEPEHPQANYCNYARLFERWAGDLLREYLHPEPDLVRTAQAKVRLIDQYFQWRTTVPKSHRNRIGENGHICIFHVFERAYQQLKMVELTLSPPPIIVQPPPAPRPLPQIGGIYLGEVVGTEE